MLAPAARRRRRRPRAVVLFAAAVLTSGSVAAGLVSAAVPAHADPIGDCTPTKGAVVAVDFGHWGGPVVRGCDANPTTGMNLLHDGGFTTTGTTHDGPGFVCRIGDAAYGGGTQYPTPADDACVLPPPAGAYWSYWIAPAGQHTWTYSPLGALGDKPEDGEAEAWVFGPTDSGGTTRGPSFTPDSVRPQGTSTTTPTTPPTTPTTTPPPTSPAGASTTPPTLRPAAAPTSPPPTTPGTAPATPTATPSGTTLPPAPAGPDLAKGVGYLIDGKNLIDGHYYESSPGFADFGMTIDGLFSLAATGGADGTLAGISDFLQHGTDAGGRDIDAWTLIGTANAQGGSLAKEAVAAEAVGADPRSFGGHDLIAALDSTVCAKADASGGCAAKDGYAYATSVFAQSLGVVAQIRAGDTAGAAGPTAYLESLQDADGAWPSLIPSGGDQDADSTAMAMMALDLVPGDAAAQAVAKGAAWLAGSQLPDGGFHGAAGDSVNSAALAVQGLSLDGAGGGKYTAQIAKARAFLAAEQNPDGGFRVASDAVGQSASDLRASAQAVGGAAGTSFGTLLRDVHDQKAAAAGSAYLVRQLGGSDHLSTAFGPDYGLTADLSLALASTGGQDKTLTRTAGYLAGHVADYADPDGTTAAAPGPYSGADAKLGVLAEVMGQDPHTFGGFDLITTLLTHVCTAATDNGFCTAPGDFSQAYSTVSQALGVLAIARAGQAPPAAAVDRLLQLQCKDGGFSSTLIAAGADCTSDVDTTGYAVQALTLVPGHADAVAAARAYLVKAQQSSGGYQGAAGVNTNSTALAVQALLATDRLRPEQARTGQEFLISAQNTDGGFRITAGTGDSDTRSTTQAVPALAGTPLSMLTHALGPITGTGGGGGGNGGSSGGSGSGSGSGSGAAPGGGGTLAATGTAVLPLAGAAGILLAAGAAMTTTIRRRSATVGRRW